MPRLSELMKTAVGRIEPSFDASDLRCRAANRRRRRRSIRAATAGATLVAIGVVAVALLTSWAGTGRPTARVQTPEVVHNLAARASIALPAGWRQLPTSTTTAPQEILVVGTSDRPAGEPVGDCTSTGDGTAPGAFVSVYEYLTGDQLNAPDHQSTYDATQFISRPADFAAALASGPPCAIQPIQPLTNRFAGPLTTTSSLPSSSAPPTTGSSPTPTSTLTTPTSSPLPQGSHVADYTFLDGGRFFVARVFSTGDPDKAHFRQALSVLNGLNIDVPPDVTTTTAAGTTTTTVVSPRQEDSARQAILDAIRAAFGGGGPLTSDQAIAGGNPIGPASRPAVREAKKQFIGVIVPRIDWLTLDTPSHATVNFDLLIDGRTITANTTGEAVYLDQRWQITADTFCTIAHRGNVTCPSR